MPESRKRKVEAKDESQIKHVNVQATKGGKILLIIMCSAMVLGILIAAVALIIQYLS